MSFFRSYFEKNNTLIYRNVTNNGKNPVTEIFYGGREDDINYSRFIFKPNLTELTHKVTGDTLSISNITSHKLKIFNTISYRPDLVGGLFSDSITKRASSFKLILFKINQDWDEGNGYDFYYDTNTFQGIIYSGQSNWFYAKNYIPWSGEGVYYYSPQIITTLDFDNGDENFEADITDYVNGVLYSGYTNYGLGIAYSSSTEQIITPQRYSVGFHTKYTNTFFEPYVETIFNDNITDDRNYFYMDKTNSLYLLPRFGNQLSDVTINSVTIYDYNDLIIDTLTGDSINRPSKGIYYINYNVSSDEYPDAVIFRDVWNVTYNGITKDIEQEFYLINQSNYFTFNNNKITNDRNYFISYSGIADDESVRPNGVRKIKLNVKQYYQHNNNPFEIDYRIYVKQGDNINIEVIPFTNVNRLGNDYWFDLDTNWLIQNIYYIELRLKLDGQYFIKSPIKFKVLGNI
jgi:hypothetical protein